MLRKRVALVLALAGVVLAVAPAAGARPDRPFSGDRSGSLIVAG
jgi:hypothetical protein